MTDTGLARFIDRFTMEHVRFYPHPVERVWRALTVSELSAKWFTEVDFALEVGAQSNSELGRRPAWPKSGHH